MVFQLISKKIVKPQFAKPPSLRNYKLSLLDKLMNSKYVPLALFYPNPENCSQISSILEESLAKTLAFYYPFAGRLKDNTSIDCSEMGGATFYEARIRCPMFEILNDSNIGAQNVVFPSGLPWNHGHDQSTLVVAQLSHFDCGGKALSVCIPHNIADAYTVCRFANDWAIMARQPSAKISPQFIGADVLPPIDDPSNNEPDLDVKEVQNCVTKRFVFDSKKLSQLKARASAELGLQNTTRFEVLSALLYKCGMAASSVVNSSSFKPSILGSVVNLRPLVGPLVTENYVGNLVSKFYISTSDERESKFSELVSKIRREKTQFFEKYNGIKTNDLVSATLDVAKMVYELLQNDIDEFESSSVCGFPIYHIDFGWGRPINASFGSSSYKNFFILMDNYDVGGIEALMTLEDQVMSVFQSDPELLAFATPTSRC